ncbi:MAG: hypothetical protein QXE10_01365 [Desulfurococcaceae archaeon]
MAQMEEDAYGEFIKVYIDVVKLAEKGLDVTHLVEELKKAHYLLLNNETSEAALLLSSIKDEVKKLENNAPSLILYMNASKALLVALLASMPLLVYILLPRLYLYLWFKTRRKWVIKHEPTR